MSDDPVYGRPVAAITNWLTGVHKTMRLYDWTIQVKVVRIDDPNKPAFDDDSYLACATITKHRAHLSIQIHPSFFDYPEIDQRHALAHELLHAHLGAAWDYVDSVFLTMGLAAGEIARTAHTAMMERATDDIAAIIVPFLPELTYPEEEAEDAAP